MRRIFALLMITGALACSALGQPVVTAVVNKASYGAFVSPGSWVIIAGYNFASSSQSAQGSSLPTTLGGMSVTVAGVQAPLLSVSPHEIDALIPAQVTIPQTTAVPLVVASGAGSVTYNIRLTRNAPGIYSRADTGQALVFSANFQPLITIAPQQAVIFYATGLGPTDSTGRVVDAVDVYIGERKATLIFAGLAPGLPGIYQVNAVVPRFCCKPLGADLVA